MSESEEMKVELTETSLAAPASDKDMEAASARLSNGDGTFSAISPAGEEGYAIIERVETKKKKTILNRMTIDFPEGCVTAILGPSGGGKTTLLDLLTGSLSRSVLASSEVNLPGSNAYVPQDDRLHGFYTCEKYMKHYTRLSGRKLDAETNEHIDSILDSLGLSNHKNTIVGDIFLKGLSGGQKRRLSVALETLTNPQNFFLDEPTSGLDSESAYQVMKFLKEYVRKAPGRRVILTIHQPSSFIWQLIDHAVLLSKGKLMYQGSRSQMEDFFASAGYPTPPQYNPADHYLTSVNDEFTFHDLHVDDWNRKFLEWKKDSGANLTRRRSSHNTRASFRRIETNRAGSFTVAVELTRRYFANLFFNPGILGTRIAMYVMLSLLIGILFWKLGDLETYSSIQSRIALTFYCVAFFVFMSIAVMPFALMERGIVEKEVRNGYYHPAVYQLAQAIASIPGTALLAFLTTIVIIPMTGLREPLWYYLNMFLALGCAEALAQLVAHLVPHFIVGMALIAGFYGLFMLLQGFMLVPSEFPNWLRWSYNVAFHTYSWRTFMYSEFGGGVTFSDSPELQTGQQVLEIYEIEDVNRGNDMIVLVCYALIIHLLSFAVLHIKWLRNRKHNASVVTESNNGIPLSSEHTA